MITPSRTTGKEGLHWIYLSPHLDDAVLSCGGLIWEQSQADGQIEVWTICAGDPPDGALSPFAEMLHQRWQTGREAVAQRRQEDLHSCMHIGALARHFSIPDCIYRQENHTGRFLYASEATIMGPVDPAEEPLINALSEQIARDLPAGAVLVAPLALGGHIDHRLVRAAAERLAHPNHLWYYSDYPYVLRCAQDLLDLRKVGWDTNTDPVSAEGLTAWQSAIAAHASQISTFWPDLQSMQAAILAFLEQNGGVQLWQKPA